MFFDPLEDRGSSTTSAARTTCGAGVLRAIGDPAKRFAEDKLRLLRAVRMAARFELTIDPATADAIRAMAPGIAVVSAERIADELRKMLVDRHRARGMRLFVDLGLAAPLLPELLPMSGLPQGLPRRTAPPCRRRDGRPSRTPPRGDLWEHVLRVLDLLGDGPSFPLAFAALLHDVGKPRTVGRTPERYTFYGHEHVGRRMASEICLRLKTVQRGARTGRMAGGEAPDPGRRAGRCGRASSRRCWPIPASASCWPCTGPTPWPAAGPTTTSTTASGCCRSGRRTT